VVVVLSSANSSLVIEILKAYDRRLCLEVLSLRDARSCACEEDLRSPEPAPDAPADRSEPNDLDEDLRSMEQGLDAEVGGRAPTLLSAAAASSLSAAVRYGL